MRLDKFLKLTYLIKRRTVAHEACLEGFILINGKVAKPSTMVRVNDVITLNMYNYYKEVHVLLIPSTNQINKQDLDKYIKILNYRTEKVT